MPPGAPRGLQVVGGELLSGLLGMPMDVERFLRFAVCVAAAVGKVHHRGLIHKDIKPANILVGRADGEGIGLTGFGMASRLVRERPELDIRILCWKSALPVSATQHFFPHRAKQCFKGTPVRFRLDATVPNGACPVACSA